MHIYI